jgi:hypothetical protein
VVQPLPAGVEKRQTLAQLRLATLSVAGPVHAFGRQQQVQVVVPGQQLLLDPRWAR